MKRKNLALALDKTYGIGEYLKNRVLLQFDQAPIDDIRRIGKYWDIGKSRAHAIGLSYRRIVANTSKKR